MSQGTQRRRRILMVIRHPVGGIRTYLKYTFACLNPEGYELRIILVGGVETSSLRKDLDAYRPEFVQVREEHAVPDLMKAVWDACRRWKPDIVHSHGFTAGVASTLATTLTGTRHIITSHDVVLDHHFQGPVGRVKRAILTAALNRADILHAVGEGAAANLVRYLPGLKKSILRMVRNGVPPPPLNDPAEGQRWREEIAKPREAIFGFFGRFMPQKGFETLIEAAALLTENERYKDRFRIVAVNDGSFILEYQAEIRRRGLSDRFSFPGFVPNARRLMPWVDAVVMPSRWEACPLQPMEAMCAGVPLITTTIPGVDELVAGAPALTLRPGDSGALAAAMADIIAHPEDHREVARQFAPAAAERFDVRLTAAGLEKLYDSLISPSIGQPGVRTPNLARS